MTILRQAAILLPLSLAVAWRAAWTITTPSGPTSVETFQAQAAFHFGNHTAIDGIPLDRCVWLPTARIDERDLEGWQIQRVLGYDPKAVRWVIAGRDGVPGHPGWDDDGNGLVDDHRELGAAWSDDLLVVTSAELPPPGPAKSMGTGGFRPADGTFQPTRWRIEIGHPATPPKLGE